MMTLFSVFSGDLPSIALIPYMLGYMSHFLYLKIGSKIDCGTDNAKRECIIL